MSQQQTMMQREKTENKYIFESNKNNNHDGETINEEVNIICLQLKMLHR